MLNIFIEFSAFCVAVTSICRFFILSRKNLTLTTILFFLAIACELRNPHIFSTVLSESRAGLIAHILTLCAAILMIQFAYSLYVTDPLLDNKLLYTLYRMRWLILIFSIVILICLYGSEDHCHTPLELSSSFYARTYWLVFATIFGISAMTVLYTTYLFDLAHLNTQIKVCIYCIRIFAFLNAYYSVSKFISQFYSFPAEFIEYITRLSISLVMLILTLAGALPILEIFRKKNPQYDY